MTKPLEKGGPFNNMESGNNGGSSSPAKEMSPPSPASAMKKGSNVEQDVCVRPVTISPIIYRNEHWRFMSSFHGLWLQLPIKILEIIAIINYNTPRPHPFDSAVLFDVLKIRKAVDEATTLVAGAENDSAPSTLVNVNGGAARFNPFRHGTKLSRDRKVRMRELACQKLAHAFRLDEIACSLATKQGSPALEEVASSVLQKKPDDPNAKYVHFFHGKVSSNQLVETTSLLLLTDVIESANGQAEALRTRATVKALLGEFDGAIQDLNTALDLQRCHVQPHDSSRGSLGSERSQTHGKGRIHDIVLPEKDQPSGLVAQLLFQRASVYIVMACRYIKYSISPSPPQKPPGENENPNRTPGGVGEAQEVSSEQLKYRRHVKHLAKRALRDYTSFLSYFDYSPNLPKAAISEFSHRLSHAAKGDRKPLRSFGTDSASKQHVVYRLSDLFAAVPPSHLPAHPFLENGDKDEAIKTGQNGPEPNTSEIVTYHPLLTEALHSLLLCHCLVQTPVKELQRHAYMVARLVRLCRSHPVFHGSETPAQSDWVKVLDQTKGWLPLGSTWKVLCTPTLRVGDAEHDSFMSAATSLVRKNNAATSTPDVRKLLNNLSRTSISDSELNEYPLLQENKTLFVRWILEVPVVRDTKRRNKRSKGVGVTADTVQADMSMLDMGEE